MNLADHIIAAMGTEFDLTGIVSNVGHHLKGAERFDMSDDVAAACYELIESKPSTLNAALPMCRMPYAKMWIEYSGGILKENNFRDSNTAPIPTKQGFLLESPMENTAGLQGQVGWATLGWIHRKLDDNIFDAVNISPFSIYFDWREDGDVRDNIVTMHKLMLERYPCSDQERNLLRVFIEEFERRFVNGELVPEEAAKFFMTRRGWEKLANNPKEIEALRESERHMLPGLSPHGISLLLVLLKRVNKAGSVLKNFMADIQGEGPFIECFLAMLNSRNCVERESVDLSRLNKARQKRGKPPLLNYTKTKLVLSRSQARVARSRGMPHEVARQHLVRGHFKIRRTGVYWWSPFLRGNAARGTIERAEYDVAIS